MLSHEFVRFLAKEFAAVIKALPTGFEFTQGEGTQVGGPSPLQGHRPVRGGGGKRQAAYEKASRGQLGNGT